LSKTESGLFITFEGGEGAGKTSQIKKLQEKLTALGHSVVVSREPGGTPGAEIMRHVLLSGAAEKFGPEMEAILFSAARSDHVQNVIKPALQRGDIVLCDRFVDSTRVYQGVSGKVEMSFLEQLEDIVCEDAWPDITLLLDLDPASGMDRAKKRRAINEKPDRFEKDALTEQKTRRDGFIKIAKANSDRIKIVDAAGTIETVAQRIWKLIAQKLKKRGLAYK